MLKLIPILTVLLLSSELCAQNRNHNDIPLFHSNSTNISFGPIYGLHPNLRNEYPTIYYFVEGNTNFNVKDIPFKMSFRHSDEKLRSGKVNYFRLSLDVQALQKRNVNSYRELSEEYLNQIDFENQQLKILEGKLAYLHQKQKELKVTNQNQHKLSKKTSIDSLIIPELALSLDTSFNFNQKANIDSIDFNVNTPKLKSENDSNLDTLHNIMNSVLKSKENIKNLEVKYSESLSNYKSIQNKTGGANFLSSVKKLDVGLTSINKSSFSSNSLPIEGVRFAYQQNKYFVDFSSGFTLPNQLISNKIFDQLVYNSENILNSSSFFQVNNTRFVTNVTSGYGDVNGNYLAIENYYVGKINSIESSKHIPDGRTVTTNLTGNTNISFVKGLTWKNTIGLTWYKEDSLYQTQDLNDKIGYSSKLNYELKKSNIQVNYRYLSKEYDGWVQGIYLQQTDRLEILLKQALGKNIRLILRTAKNRYAVESVFGRRQTNEGGVDLNLKINTRVYLSSAYTILQLSERNSQALSSNHISHLGRVILTSTKNSKNYSFVTNHEIGMVSMQVIDTNQKMLNAVTGYRINLRQVGIGLQINYTRFEGFNELKGQNIVVQPELSYRNKSFYLMVNGQYLISQQFGNVFGGKIILGFSFDKYVDLNFIFQKYLPTDFLFYEVVDEFRKPLYFKMSMNVHLFSPHKR